MILKRLHRKYSAGIKKIQAAPKNSCSHFHMDLDKKVRSKLLLKVMQQFTCEDHGEHSQCKKYLWFCTRCDKTHCGGNKRSSKPPDSAEEHMQKSDHPLVMQLDSNEVLWCFTCGNLISVASSVEKKTHRNIKKRENVKLKTGESTEDDKGLCRYHVRGMENKTSICYYNAVLQILLSLELLRDHFVNATDYAPGSVGYMLRDLYLATDQNSETNAMRNEHGALLARIRALNPDKFHESVQEDSQDLLLTLLDNLRTDDANQGFIENTFGIRSMETLICECDHENKYRLHMDDLNLGLVIPSIHISEKGNMFKAIANKMTGRSGKRKTQSERGETPGKDLELADTQEVVDVAADKGPVIERAETSGKNLEPKSVDKKVDADDVSKAADVSGKAVQCHQGDDTSKAQKGSNSADVSEEAVEGHGGDDTSKAERGSDSADVSEAEAMAKRKGKAVATDDDESNQERRSKGYGLPDLYDALVNRHHQLRQFASTEDEKEKAEQKKLAYKYLMESRAKKLAGIPEIPSGSSNDGKRDVSLKIPKLPEKRTKSSEAKHKPDHYVVDNTNGKISIERVLANMIWTKESENAKFCSCEKSLMGRPAYTSFIRAPVILVLHLLRFGCDQNRVGYKTHGHVAFKETMIYGQATLEGRSDAIDVIYQLKGVVEHIGHYKAGHYVSYVKGGCPGQGWLLVDNEEVEPVTLERVLRCEAYLLFYKRIR